MKAIVAALDRHNGIGADNDLLWQRDLPADLAHFKRLTTGRTIIMGRKTFESIGRPLPERENIVVSSQPTGVKGVLTALSLPAAYALARNDIYIIGGGQIYQQTIDDVDKLYITYVDAEFPQATVFFPQINCQDWVEVSRDHSEADERNKYAFDFVEYERVTE